MLVGKGFETIDTLVFEHLHGLTDRPDRPQDVGARVERRALDYLLRHGQSFLDLLDVVHDFVNAFEQVVRHLKSQVGFEDHTEHGSNRGLVLAQWSLDTTLGKILKGQVVGTHIPMELANSLLDRKRKHNKRHHG